MSIAAWRSPDRGRAYRSLLVATSPVRDLLFRAKNLFIAAKVATDHIVRVGLNYKFDPFATAYDAAADSKASMPFKAPMLATWTWAGPYLGGTIGYSAGKSKTDTISATLRAEPGCSRPPPRASSTERSAAPKPATTGSPACCSSGSRET